MLCVWQGHIVGTPWPRHDPPVVELRVELWSSHADAQLQCARLEFDSYVCLNDVPLWTIAGPEMQVFTQDCESVQYFSELAALKTKSAERAAVRLTIAASDDAKHDSLLVYAIRDEGDPTARVVARPLLLHPRLVSPPASPKPASRINPGPAQVASADQLPVPRQSPVDAPQNRTKKQAVPDVKRAIQQTVLGALRLRGVGRDNPDFKVMYHIISRAAEFALRNHGKDIDVNDVHEKVEALLAVIE